MGAHAPCVQFMICVFGLQLIIMLRDFETNIETLVSNMSKVHEIMTVGGGEQEAYCDIFGMEYKPSRRRRLEVNIQFGGSSEEMLEDFDLMTSMLVFTMVRFMALTKFYIGTGWLVIGTVSKMALKTPNRFSVYVIYSLTVWVATSALLSITTPMMGRINASTLLPMIYPDPNPDPNQDGECNPSFPMFEGILFVTLAFVLLSMLLGARYVRYIKTDKQVQPALVEDKNAPAAGPGDKSATSDANELSPTVFAPPVVKVQN
jgi:hypothetical protein